MEDPRFSIQLPAAIEHVAYEGALKRAEDAAPPPQTRAGGGERRRGVPNRSDPGGIRQLPIVSIGKPVCWPLDKIGSPEVRAALAELRVKSRMNYYVARLSCSFRSQHRQSWIEWARFAVALYDKKGASHPVAFDMYPLLVSKEVQRNRKVTLNPSLKFKEVEGSLGELSSAFEYTEIQPVVSATGVGESQPSWDYESHGKEPVTGAKFMHLLVAAPETVSSCWAHLDVVADVRVGGSLLKTLLRRRDEASDSMSHTLW